MRAAVLVLTKTPNPRQAEVRSLCLPWKVRQKDQQRDRPLATLITELQQAVISEGNKLRGSFNCESGAPASSVAQRSGTANEAPHHREETSAAQRDPTTKRCRLSGLLPVADNQPQGGAATSSSTALPTNSIEQLTATTTANPSMFKRSVEVTSAAQPGRRAKVSRQGALATIEEDTRDVRSLARLHDQETSASQPGPKTKQRRLTAMFLASDSQQAGSSASSSSSSLIPIEGNASAAQPGVTAATAAAAAATAPLAVPAAAGPEHVQRSILQYGSKPDDLAELRRAMFQLVKDLTHLKRQSAPDDDGTQTLTKLLTQAQQLQQVPASCRTLESPEVRSLYISDCGKLYLRRQPYRDHRREFKLVTTVACRSLFSSVQMHVITREPLSEAVFPFLAKFHSATTSTTHRTFPRTVQELHARLNEADALPTAPFGNHEPNDELFKCHAWYSLTMLAAMELPDVPLHVLLSTSRTAMDLQEVVAQRRTRYAQTAASEQLHSNPTVAEVCEVLIQFYDDSYAQHVKQDWLVKALNIPEDRRHDMEHIAELFNTATEDFFLHCQQHGITGMPLSKHTLSACTLFRFLLTSQKPTAGHILRFGPVLRLLANFKGECGQKYIPQDKCGADVELAANRLPAYFTRLADSAAQPVLSPSSAAQPAAVASDLMMPVASPPVMCWICGEGFTHNNAFFQHCTHAHGGYAEYRKRLLWRAQQDGFKPLLPWVKRHILQSATFHLTFSVPGSCSLHWNHPDAFEVATTRCEVACVICARKDWSENRFPVYLWREATDRRSSTELQHTQRGTSSFLTCGEILCFGNRALINDHLSVDGYMDRRPLIPKAELLASSVIHPADESMAWLMHSRRIPLLPNSRKSRTNKAHPPAGKEDAPGSAEQPADRSIVSPSCAGVGDPDQTARICFNCASCLCVDDKLIKIPEYALANDFWIGRQRVALQNGSLGLRMLLGLGRPCFRKLLLGKGQKDTLQSGFTGNHILISQASASLVETLPPPSTQLKDSFVVIFGQDAGDLRKCQLLTVQREAYRSLVTERAQVNDIFSHVPLDEAAANALPLNGVPQQLLECAVQIPEVEHYKVTRAGPGTIRDPLDASCPPDDASDEVLSDDDHDQNGHVTNPAGEAASASTAQSSSTHQETEQLNHFETPIGIDPTAVPTFVQHVAAFKHNLAHVRDLVSSSRALHQHSRSADHSSAAQPASLPTAKAAAEEECFRAVVDLRETARKLNDSNWERNLAVLDKAAECDQALFVPSQKPLSMFDPTTWCKCFSEWWFGDGLPNDPVRPRKITFEMLFAALLHREELEYHLDSDQMLYQALGKSRFDTPEHVCVFGDTLRRLALFRGTRAAVRRRGFQRDVRLIANASSAHCLQALSHEALGGANTEALARDDRVFKELATALRQVLISTKDVPLTDGYKRNLRHEGHNLNVMFGSLTVFTTFNFADNYTPLLFTLCNGSECMGDITCDLSAGQPEMPSLHRMHQLIAESPRAQVIVRHTFDKCCMVFKWAGWVVGEGSGKVGQERSKGKLGDGIGMCVIILRVCLAIVRSSSSSSWTTSWTSISWVSMVLQLAGTMFLSSSITLSRKTSSLPLACPALVATELRNLSHSSPKPVGFSMAIAKSTRSQPHVSMTWCDYFENRIQQCCTACCNSLVRR